MRALRPYQRLHTPVLLDGLAPMAADARVYRSGQWSVVEIVGELDLLTAPLVPPLLAEAGPLVVFDLTRLTFMDCRGLGLLAGAASAASEGRGRVRVAGASRQVRKLGMLGLLDGSLSMFDSLQDALTAPTGHGREAALPSPRQEAQPSAGRLRATERA